MTKIFPKGFNTCMSLFRHVNTYAGRIKKGSYNPFNTCLHYIAAFFILFLLISCTKKIPPATPFDPEETFKTANELFEKKKYDEARRELHKIRRKETEIKYAPLAQLRIADSYLEEDEPEAAVEEYRRFLEEYPRHRYASYAQYRIAMIYFDMIKDAERGYGAAEKALEEFERLNLFYPRNPYRDEVARRIRKTEDILAEHEFMVGEFYYKKNAHRGALKRFLGLLEKFPGYKKEADVLYRIAASYRRLGDKDRAGEYFNLLITRYPDSEIAEKAKREFKTNGFTPE